MRKNKLKKIKTYISILLLFSLSIISFGCSDVSMSYSQKEQAIETSYILNNEIEEVTLYRVVDGDTLEIVKDNQTFKVRLIGIDCPESVSSNKSLNCEEGRLASTHTKELLTSKKTIYISKDKSETDKYDRLLRFVWLEKPNTFSKSEIKTKMLNAKILSDGYAQAKDYKPDTSLSVLFHQLEKEASENSLGVSEKWK